MPEPLKPMIPKPEEVKQLKTGEQHMFLGCVFFFLGLAGIGALIYVFRDFFFENALYSVIGLMIASSLIRMVMFKIKGK